MSSAPHPRRIDDRVPASARTAPAPPLPLLHGEIRLRYAEPDGEDLRRIHAWMNAPHVAPYWQQDWPQERWRAHLGQMYEDDYERPYIAEFRGEPVAYVELYRAARDVVAEHYDADPWDLGLHGAIGERSAVGKNLAFRFWLEVIPAIFAAEERCTAVVTDPAADHPVAVRLDQLAADRMGGQRLGEVRLPHKRAVLFRFPRPDRTSPPR
ncbi:MAG: GNAT family N-acetyltransferase [Pseudoclavibacter sp.]|nr:GNAT family N-acetyltransferase [Pseudoclavibacter sp.]